MNRQRRPSPSAALLFLGVLASTLATPRGALALAPRYDDEPAALAPRLDQLDVAPHELWAAAPGRAGPLWIALQIGVARVAGGERSITALLLASLPLERLHGRAPSGAGRLAFAEGEAPRLKPLPSARPPRAPLPIEPSPPSSEPDASDDAAPLPLPVRITPDVVRAAVDAALRRARLADPEARLDALATRARTSALLPELRLRATHLVDEAENLAPTEYDPARKTASGGTSLWLEARATWQLDRLVFADEEVALERMRRERAEAQAKLVGRVLELLFTWQRAVALEADPNRGPEERRAATLQVIECEASLALVTDGWFTRWNAARAAKASAARAAR